MQPFNPQAYIDKLREGIKKQLVDIIPEEQWTKLVEAEVTAFFKDGTERTGYGGERVVVSEFKRVMREVMAEETKTRIKSMLASKEWTDYWDGSKQVAGSAIVDLLKEHGAAIINDWLKQAIAQVVAGIRFQS